MVSEQHFFSASPVLSFFFLACFSDFGQEMLQLFLSEIEEVAFALNPKRIPSLMM